MDAGAVQKFHTVCDPQKAGGLFKRFGADLRDLTQLRA